MSYIEVVKEVKKYTMGDTMIAANDACLFFRRERRDRADPWS